MRPQRPHLPNASRRAARQFVLHGHITVNGKKAAIPSMKLKANDKVAVRNREDSKAVANVTVEEAESRGIAKWLALDKDTLSGMVLRIPTRDEINPTVDEQQIVELYSK